MSDQKTIEINKNFQPFRLSPITREIETLLEEKNSGEHISYEEIKTIARMDCDSSGEGYSYLDSARKRLGQRGHHFVTIPGVGLKKLHPNEAVSELSHQQQINGKRTRRRLMELISINTDDLGPNEKMEHMAGVFVGRVASRILSKKVNNKVIANIRAGDQKAIDHESLITTYLRTKT